MKWNILAMSMYVKDTTTNEFILLASSEKEDLEPNTYGLDEE